MSDNPPSGAWASCVSVGGLASLGCAGLLWYLSNQEGAKAKRLEHVHCHENLDGLRAAEGKLPVLVALRGRVNSRHPKKCELSDKLAVYHELLEEEVWRRERENGRVVNEPFEVKRLVDRSEWFLEDGASSTCVKVEGAHQAERWDSVLHSAAVFVPEDSSKASLAKFLLDKTWRIAKLGVRKSERYLPVGSVITVVGQLDQSILARDTLPPNNRGAGYAPAPPSPSASSGATLPEGSEGPRGTPGWSSQGSWLLLSPPWRTSVGSSSGGSAGGGGDASGGSPSGLGPSSSPASSSLVPQASAQSATIDSRGSSSNNTSSSSSSSSGSSSSGSSSSGSSSSSSGGSSSSGSSSIGSSSSGGSSSGGSFGDSAEGCLVVRRPPDGPFIVTPLTLQQLRAEMSNRSRWCKYAAVGLGAVGLALLARKVILRLMKAYRERQAKRRMAIVKEQMRQRAAARAEAGDTGASGDAGTNGAADAYDADRAPGTCVVCIDRAVEMVFTGCGHLCCCEVCAGSLRSCPVCRMRGSAIKVFRP